MTGQAEQAAIRGGEAAPVAMKSCGSQAVGSPSKPAPKTINVSAANQKLDPLDVAFWFAVLTFASVGMTVGNKAVMLQYPYANTLSMLQNGVTSVFLVLAYFASAVPINKLTGKQLRTFAVTAFFLAMQIMSSLKSLPLVAIATTVVFRNLATVTVAVFDFLFMGAKFTDNAIIALFVTMIGMSIYAGTDVNYDLTGYFWLLVNAAATVSNTIWNKVFITKYATETKEQTTYGISLIQQMETLPIFAALAYQDQEFAYPEPGAFSAPAGSIGALLDQSAPMLFLIFFTCVGGLVLSVTYSKIFSLVSPTTVTVASTSNKAVSILFGCYLFDSALSAKQIIGLVICLGGGLWYATEAKKKPSATESRGACGGVTQFCVQSRKRSRSADAIDGTCAGGAIV